MTASNSVTNISYRFQSFKVLTYLIFSLPVIYEPCQNRDWGQKNKLRTVRDSDILRIGTVQLSIKKKKKVGSPLKLATKCIV